MFNQLDTVGTRGVRFDREFGKKMDGTGLDGVFHNQ